MIYNQVYIKGDEKMNSTIRKIACAAMALTLATGVFTGCSSGDTEWFLENKISLKEQNGSLFEEGTVGDIQYKILEKGALSTHASESGYYIDRLEQLDSPYFIVITSGPTEYESAEISIVDLGMDGSTLQILVSENDGTGGSTGSKFTPACVLEVDQLPEDIQIHDKTGKVFNLIEK